MKRHGRLWASAIAAAAAWAVYGEPTARADLQASTGQVVEQWRAAGATVVTTEPHFLNDDETIALALPEAPRATCTTLLVMGDRELGFDVAFAGPADESDGEHLASQMGAVTLEHCGRTLPRRILVASSSGRGTLEIVVASSREPLPSLGDILPERRGAEEHLTEPPAPGALPVLESQDKRASIVEGRARRDGAVVVGRSTLVAALDGTGSTERMLVPGCHLLSLFAKSVDTKYRSERLDLDAELHTVPDDRLVSRDRTDAPDARLSLCVGDDTAVEVVFVGALSRSAVLLSHCMWRLPDHLPTVWGHETRAKMAEVLLSHRVGSLSRDPVALAQGGAGSVSVPMQVEPGGCYLALAVLLQGSAHDIGLRVQAGARVASDDHGVDDVGALVAFCAGEASQALAQVEVHGPPMLGWALALYRLQVGIWNVPQ
jgi:hypothetical protein